MYLWESWILLPVAVVNLCLLLYSIPLYVYVIFIHSIVDRNLSVSNFGSLRTILLWTFLFLSISWHVHTFVQNADLVVEFLWYRLHVLSNPKEFFFPNWFFQTARVAQQTLDSSLRLTNYTHFIIYLALSLTVIIYVSLLLSLCTLTSHHWPF